MSVVRKLRGLLGRDDPRSTAAEVLPEDAAGLTSYLIAHIRRQSKLPSGTVVNSATDLTTLGLDSLAMIQLSGDLEKLLGISIGPEIVFEAPTLGDLATKLHEARIEARSQPPVAA